MPPVCWARAIALTCSSSCKDAQSDGIDVAKTKVILQNIRVFSMIRCNVRPMADETTVAKTVSLPSTPEQASKLSLAENLGTVVDSAQSGRWGGIEPKRPNTRWDDLLSDAGHNSREKEQARDEAKVEAAKPNLLSVIQQFVPPPSRRSSWKSSRRNDVRQVEFDPDTGKPLRDAATEPTAPTNLPSMTPPQVPATGVSTPSDQTGPVAGAGCRRAIEELSNQTFQLTEGREREASSDGKGISDQLLLSQVKITRPCAVCTPDHEGSTRMYATHSRGTWVRLLLPSPPCSC